MGTYEVGGRETPAMPPKPMPWWGLAAGQGPECALSGSLQVPVRPGFTFIRALGSLFLLK